MSLLWSEWLKTKHTVIRWFTFFLPFCIAGLGIAYMKYRSDLSSAFVFESFYMLWSAVILPIGTGLLTGFLIHEEEMAGNFNNLLNTEVSRAKLYTSKFIFGLLSLTICTLLTSLILSIGMAAILPGRANISWFFMAALLTVIGTLPILAIHLWISFLWGMGTSIGVGICGILIAVLIGTTSLGNNIWVLLPWSYPVKMAMFPMASSFVSGTMMIEAAVQLITEFSVSMVFLVIFLSGGMFWFRKWEGRKNSG